MFYYNFVDLCNSIGKSPSAAAEEMGFKRSVVTRWSKGSEPRQATLQRIAEYFGVTVECLTGKEENEKPVTEHDDELSAVKRSFIQKLKLMDDETVLALIQIADQVLALREK